MISVYNGTIRVYDEQVTDPLLEWTDPEPLPVSFAGFSMTSSSHFTYTSGNSCTYGQQQKHPLRYGNNFESYKTRACTLFPKCEITPELQIVCAHDLITQSQQGTDTRPTTDSSKMSMPSMAKNRSVRSRFADDLYKSHR